MNSKPLGPGRLQGFLALGHLTNDWAPGAVWLLAPAIGLSFDLQPSQIGLLITVHSAGAALAYLPAGILSDRTASQGRLLLGTFWWVGLGYLLASYSPNFWSLAILLAIAGMGDAAWHPIATGVLARNFSSRRGQALGIHALGGSLAEVLSPLLVGFLLSHLEWRSVLQVSVIPPLLMGLVFFGLADRIPRSHHPRIDRTALFTLARYWTRRKGLALIVGISMYNMALIGLMTISPLFVQRSLGFSSSQTGIFFALAILIGAVGQPLAGRWSDRGGRRQVFVTGSLCGGSCAVMAAMPSMNDLAPVLLVVAMATLVVIRSSILAMAVDYSGQREATTLGFVFAVMDGVGALGAVAAGLVADFSLQYAFVLAACLSLTSVVITAGIALRR